MKKKTSLLRKILFIGGLFLCFLIFLSLSSDKEKVKPLQNYLFDRNGYYFLIQENWVDNKIRIISNPYIIEKYKDELEIEISDKGTTPQYHFIVVNDNKTDKMIGYFHPEQVKTSREFENEFKEYKEKKVFRLSLSDYSKLTDSLDNIGILWVGDKVKKYEGEFRIDVYINNDIESRYSWSDISANLFDFLTSKYPILTNRLDIFFSSSSPKDNFVIWKIDIVGNYEMSEFVKSIDLSDNNLVSSCKYGGFTENKYYLRYFEPMNDK